MYVKLWDKFRKFSLRDTRHLDQIIKVAFHSMFKKYGRSVNSEKARKLEQPLLPGLCKMLVMGSTLADISLDHFVPIVQRSLYHTIKNWEFTVSEEPEVVIGRVTRRLVRFSQGGCQFKLFTRHVDPYFDEHRGKRVEVWTRLVAKVMEDSAMEVPMHPGYR
jgi:hypothetical protein